MLGTKTQLDSLLGKHPTVVVNGIPSERAIQLADTELEIKGEEKIQYYFRFFKSQDAPVKYFFHIGMKEINSGRVINTAIYEAADEKNLREISAELKTCKENHFNLIINKIKNGKLLKIEQLFDREAAEAAVRKAMKQSDDQRMLDAKTVFDEDIGLQEAITAVVLPTLVTIKTRNGVTGTGFFQHSEWLVSNAHVIPCREILGEKASVVDGQLHELPLEADHSYHRPSDRSDSPDVVIIKTKTRHGGNNKCLPTQFSDDEDSGDRCLFYIDFNLNSGNSGTIKFLRLLSKPNTYPIVYECAGGGIPQPGCSGAPIIEARVMLGREPRWQFKVVSVLYARCDPSWYNKQQGASKQVPDNTKLVCAIPVMQDFSQILQILHEREEAIRAEQMAAACKSLGDDQGEKDAAIYSKKGAESKAAARLGLAKFEDGVTDLNIALPDGLEKLWYQGIVGIERSLLIEKVLKKELGKKEAPKFSKKVPAISSEDLQNDFDNFIKMIAKLGDLKLVKGDDFLLSPSGYFRVDVSGGGKSNWMLQIQDNTGKGNKSNKKSLSSVFAIAHIPKEHVSVKGSQLAALFDASQKKKVAQEISSLTTNHSATTPKKSSSSSSNQKAAAASSKSSSSNSKARPKKQQPDPLPAASASTNSSSSAASVSDKEKTQEQHVEKDDCEENWQEQLEKLEELYLQTATRNSLNEKDTKDLAESLKVQAQKFGFTCKDVKRDGFCLLYAIEDQLNQLSTRLKRQQKPETIPSHTYKELKEILNKHILDNIDAYKDYSALDVNSLAAQLLDYKWASDTGDFFTLALSRALNVTIFIIPSDGSKPKIFRRPDDRRTIFLGLEVGIHYQSLVPKTGLDKDKKQQFTQLIDNLIRGEKVDTWSAVAAKKVSPHARLPLIAAVPITSGISGTAPTTGTLTTPIAGGVPVHSAPTSAAAPTTTTTASAGRERARNSFPNSNSASGDSLNKTFSSSSPSKAEKREPLKPDNIGMPALIKTLKVKNSQLMVGKAHDNNDCFFDTVAQALLEIKGIPQQDAKSLRMVCHQYAHDTKNVAFKNWFTGVDGVREYEEYKAQIQYMQAELKDAGKTAVWGDAARDGQIICKKFNIRLHAINIDDAGKITHQLITPTTIESIKAHEVNYNALDIIHVACYRKHFVPLVSVSFYQQLYPVGGVPMHHAPVKSMEKYNLKKAAVTSSAVATTAPLPTFSEPDFERDFLLDIAGLPLSGTSTTQPPATAARPK